MQTKNPDLEGRAEEILDVLFSKTQHSGYWSHVQFGAMTKFFKQGNGVLSLVVLTWLRQLQQFFLDDEHTHKNGDWNKLGKYTGVTTNPMKDTTPLANINFSTIAKPKVLNQITNVNDFKPNEDITGVQYVHHWKNGHFVFSNQNNKFNCRNLLKLILKQQAELKEYMKRINSNSKSRQQILLPILMTLKWGSTILQNLTLTQTETKTCHSIN